MPPFQKTPQGDIIVDTGHRGHVSPWTQEQSAVLAASLPSWIRFGFEQHATLDGRDNILTKWKQTEANRILKLPEFQTLPESMSRTKARENIVRKFTNYRSRHLKPNGTIESAKLDFESRRLAASALVDWKTLSKGRSWFKRKNYAKIIHRRDEIMKEDPEIVQVGAFQKAFGELWQSADQDFWEKEASEENAASIFENQKLFPGYLWESLSGLCRGGGLGNAAILTAFAFRDEDGRIAGGVIEGHHAQGVKSFKDYAGDLFVSFRRTYEEWAESTLPQTKAASPVAATTFAMPKHKDGLPLFPQFNLDQVTTEVLRQVLNTYFQSVWAFCRPNEGAPPWKAIEASPSMYYDTSIYSFKISSPTQLGTIAAHTLSHVLMNISSTESVSPFRFITQAKNTDEPVQNPVLPHLTNHPSSSSTGALPHPHQYAALALALSNDDDRSASPTLSSENETTSSPVSSRPPSKSPDVLFSPLASSRSLPHPHSPAAAILIPRPSPSPASPRDSSTSVSCSSHSAGSDSQAGSLLKSGLGSRSVSVHDLSSLKSPTQPMDVDTTTAQPSSLSSGSNHSTFGAKDSMATQGYPLQLLANASSAAAKLPDSSPSPINNHVSPVNTGMQAESNGGSGLNGVQCDVGDGVGVDIGGNPLIDIRRGGAEDAGDGPSSAGRIEAKENSESTRTGGDGVGRGRGVMGGKQSGQVGVAERERGRRGANPTGEGGQDNGKGLPSEDDVTPSHVTENLQDVPPTAGIRISSRARTKNTQPENVVKSGERSIILDFLQVSRKRSLSFTLRSSGRPGKVRKIAKYDGAYLKMDGDVGETWFDRRNSEITKMLEDAVID